MGALALKQGTRRFDDGVWRIRDIDLAVGIGYAQPRDIRKRIKRDLEALAELGDIRRAILASQQHRRKQVKWRDEMKHQACVQYRHGGMCPCCHAARIVGGDGTRTGEFEIDHYSGRHHRKLTDTWAVCHSCNTQLRDGVFNRLKNPEFVAYQNTLKAFQDPGPMFRDLYD